MNQDTIDAIVTLVETGDASIPTGDQKSRTFTKNGQSVALSIVENGIVASNGNKTIGLIPNADPSFRFLHIEIKTVREATGELEDLLATSAHLVLPKVDFMQLFMLPELTDIEDLQKGDPSATPVIEIDKNVRTAMTLLDTATHVNLTKPIVQSFVGYLSTIDSPNRTGEKILTAERVVEVLAAQPPVSVL